MEAGENLTVCTAYAGGEGVPLSWRSGGANVTDSPRLRDLLAALSSLPYLGELFELVGTLAWLFFIIPVISAVVRRLRDIGINPIFALLLPVLVLAAIAAAFAAAYSSQYLCSRFMGDRSFPGR